MKLGETYCKDCSQIAVTIRGFCRTCYHRDRDRAKRKLLRKNNDILSTAPTGALTLKVE